MQNLFVDKNNYFKIIDIASLLCSQ